MYDSLFFLGGVDGVEQVMCLLPQGLFEELPVELLHVGIFMGEADVGSGIHLPEETAALDRQFLASWMG